MDEHSAALYGDVLFQVPGELDQNLSELGYAVLFRAFFDRNQTGLSQGLEMVDELAGIPYGIELCFVHYLSVRVRALRDQKLEDMKPDGSGGSIKNVRAEAFVRSLQEEVLLPVFDSLFEKVVLNYHFSLVPNLCVARW